MDTALQTLYNIFRCLFAIPTGWDIWRELRRGRARTVDIPETCIMACGKRWFIWELGIVNERGLSVVVEMD